MVAKITKKNPRGRPRAFSEERALDAAMQVFSEKGYEGASLSDLTFAMGINRFSMYATFGNKETLYVKAIERFSRAVARHIEAVLAQGTAREGVERLLLDSVAKFTAAEGAGLCFVTQAPLNEPDVSDSTRQCVARRRGAVEQALRRRLARAVEHGELSSETSVASVARFYAVMIQGIALQAQHGGTREQLLGVVAVAMGKWPD
jgi:AcrR family transcriptional regulator